MSPKFQYFDSRKFTRDDKTGYYLNSTIRKRMHRYVYEFHHGSIPDGHQIHHINGDKSDNRIENLELLSATTHQSQHWNENIDERLRVAAYAVPRAVEAARAWHKTPEGRKWHSEHAKVTFARGRKTFVINCKVCKKEASVVDTKAPKFCSNACKSKWRRDSGVDNIIQKCKICNSSFTTSKYKIGKCCSKSCAAKLRSQEARNKKLSE